VQLLGVPLVLPHGRYCVGPVHDLHHRIHQDDIEASPLRHQQVHHLPRQKAPTARLAALSSYTVRDS